MATKHVGQLGLLHFLERELGLFDNYLSDKKRIALYAESLEKSKKGTFFEKALNNDILKVAKQLLSYRDELIELGWDYTKENQPERFKDFATVEGVFSENRGYVGISDRWQGVIESLSIEKIEVFNIDKLIVDDVKEYLHPLIIKVLNKLELAGIDVKYTALNLPDNTNDNLSAFKRVIYNSIFNEFTNDVPQFKENDDSLLLLNFSNEQLLFDTMAQVANPEENIVINVNNAGVDYSLVSMGKPAGGSEQIQAHPQATQIVKLIIPCFNGELNLNTLMSFLTVPYAPVNIRLRAKLSKALAKTPGVENSNWNEIIKGFISSDVLDDNTADSLQNLVEYFDTGNVTEAELKDRKKQVGLFLTFNVSEEKSIAKGKKILLYLENWAKKIQKGKTIPELKEQFMFIENLCREVLNSFDFKSNDIKGLENMIKSFYESKNFINYKKQQKSVQVFKDISSLSVPVKETVYWLDFHAKQLHKTGGFLLEEEKIYLKKNADFHLSEEQIKLQLTQWLRGLMNSNKKLILCTVESKGNEKHQLHLRLEAIFKKQYPKIVKQINTIGDLKGVINIDTESLITATKIDLPIAKDYFKSSVLKNIEKREVESASSIEKFIQYPFDWTMQYVAKFNASVGIELLDDNLIKGNVAHKVIEKLFEISNQLDFTPEVIDQVFNKVIQEEGAVFLQPEKRFDLSEFKFRFNNSFTTLVNFIKSNKFKIEACEYTFGNDADCVVEELLGKVRGAIDLYLIDEEGKPFIIDLKWTYSDKKYKEKIENNEAIQLALYTAAINKRELSKTAYFMLNQNCVITASKRLKGENIISINTVDDNAAVLEKIKNSLEFRWSELRKGNLEMGEDYLLEALGYQQEQNVITLPKDKKNKKANPYTGFKLFKGNLN